MGKELGIDGSGRAWSLAPFELRDLGGPMGTIGLTPNEKRVAEDRRDCYWLYVVTDCDAPYVGSELEMKVSKVTSSSTISNCSKYSRDSANNCLPT